MTAPLPPPRITLVTPSLNQGAYLERTIRSVLDQGYPDLEHIVVDGLSTDDTAAILARYPHLIVIREQDRSQAEAINKGFRRATGAILGFLNADDTLAPGALDRVARELAPERGRHIVMGRCRFIDAEDRFTGIEHPSQFVDHARVLAIWKGHCLPQPAVFWTREVWERCGPLDESERLVPDYELFCRFSRDYPFHRIDQVLANYRLHPDSITCRNDDRARLERSIAVSRRYWGSPLSPRFWRLGLSLLRYRIDRRRRGRELLRAAAGRYAKRRYAGAALLGLAGTLLAPGITFYVAVYPPLRRRARGLAGRLLARLAARSGPPTAQSAAYLEADRVWDDGWAGPRVVFTVAPQPGERALRLSGTVEPALLPGPQSLEIRLGDRPAVPHALARGGDFAIEVALDPADSAAAPVALEVRAAQSFVPHAFWHNDDHRPRAWRLRRLEALDAAGNARTLAEAPGRGG